MFVYLKNRIGCQYKVFTNNNILKFSRAEFKEFMTSLGMRYSRKKWNKIFHQIDLNFDDAVRV